MEKAPGDEIRTPAASGSFGEMARFGSRFSRASPVECTGSRVWTSSDSLQARWRWRGRTSVRNGHTLFLNLRIPSEQNVGQTLLRTPRTRLQQ